MKLESNRIDVLLQIKSIHCNSGISSKCLVFIEVPMSHGTMQDFSQTALAHALWPQSWSPVRVGLTMKQLAPNSLFTVPTSVFIQPCQLKAEPSDQVRRPSQPLFSQFPPPVAVRPAEGFSSSGTGERVNL